MLSQEELSGFELPAQVPGVNPGDRDRTSTQHKHYQYVQALLGASSGVFTCISMAQPDEALQSKLSMRLRQLPADLPTCALPGTGRPGLRLLPKRVNP